MISYFLWYVSERFERKWAKLMVEMEKKIYSPPYKSWKFVVFGKPFNFIDKKMDFVYYLPTRFATRAAKWRFK